MLGSEVLRAWGKILIGRVPSLSIEVTRECPLRCPGCYAYGEDHLGAGLLLRQVRDFRGLDLVHGILRLVDEYRPIHVSLVGGEPLVRYRELSMLLPVLSARRIHTQIVTSAVRSIPPEWSRLPFVSLVVSIDGLQPEHDARRTPATYERIMKNIGGHKVTVHCTITRQMTARPGYLREFVAFWSGREEVRKIWMSIFTPQKGDVAAEILSPSERAMVIRELELLRAQFTKLDTPRELLQAYLDPPANPGECIFARTTRSITADLKGKISPCQFGGNPDCAQCGCIASAGMMAIARHRLPLGIRVGAFYEVSYRLGAWINSLRERARERSRRSLDTGCFPEPSPGEPLAR